MKPNLINVITLLSVLLFNNAYAQKLDNIKPININGELIKYINLQSAKSIYRDTIHYNKTYKYILQNVNRFVYKETSATQAGTDLFTDMPDILKAFSIPSFTTKQVSENPDENSGKKTNNSFKDQNPKSQSPQHLNPPCTCISYNDLISESTLNNALINLNKQKPKYEKIVNKFGTYDSLNKLLEALKINAYNTFGTIKKNKIDAVHKFLNLSLDEKDSTQLIAQEYNKTVVTATQLQKIIETNSNILITAFNEKIEQLKSCIKCVDSCKEHNQIRLKLYDEYETLNRCIKNLQDTCDKFKATLNKVNDALTAMKTAIKDGKIAAVENNYNLLTQENFQLELDPFIADKDVHELTFTINAGVPLPYGSPLKKTIKINAITYGWNLKVDYSTGIFYSWGSDKFLGPSYYFDVNRTDTTKTVREAPRSHNGMLSIGAFMHIYPRLWSPVKPGIAIGVSTTTGFTAVNLHIGASAIIGKQGKASRVIITFGATAREVSLLDNRYQIGKPEKTYGDTVPTSNNFPVWGGFAAIT